MTDSAIFVDLSMMGDAKTFDGMAAGSFTDMWGRDTVFDAVELPVYVANTKRALESTRDSSGQIVGFPVDAMNHNGAEAAGWIVDVNLADGRNVIEFTPRWNDLGRDAIGRDVMRFFSPTIDVNQKVIIGGSLTNWPATRSASHDILLRPVELSAQISTFAGREDSPLLLGNILKSAVAELKTVLSGLVRPANQTAKEGDPMTEDEGTTTTTETPEVPAVVTMSVPTIPAVVDLSSPDVIALINERAEARATALLAEKEQKARIAQLAIRLTGGTAEKPVGLSVGHDRIAAFLSNLPAELLPEAEAILLSAAESAPIPFEEIGHSRVMQGTQQLPESIKPALVGWLARGLSLEDFFTANSVELGAMSDYDLTQFINKEGK